MRDIAKELRDLAATFRMDQGEMSLPTLLMEAAKEIEILRSRLKTEVETRQKLSASEAARQP